VTTGATSGLLPSKSVPGAVFKSRQLCHKVFSVATQHLCTPEHAVTVACTDLPPGCVTL
jgi:hypothetical protein